MRINRVILLLGTGILTYSFAPVSIVAQSFHRVWLSDKGTPTRSLPSADPLYPVARALIGDRAVARRSKTLPADALLTTRDLPLYQPYLDSITSRGAFIRVTSRWMNTTMVTADSATIASIRSLSFVDSVTSFDNPDLIAGKRSVRNKWFASSSVAELPVIPPKPCFVDEYGLSDEQNRAVGFDAAHSIGISGHGVLIGILDAGFDWRSHVSLKNADVIAEYDFVNGDGNTADEPGDPDSEDHGTIVMSVIAGNDPGELIGGAPHASFALAKTEDVRSERNIEEDFFVAGLEWLESLGVDVTNTSLGYTTFDSPEFDHTHAELTGSTLFASRAVNHATSLGVVCVISAGNEFTSFRFVGVPAEADSALAVAALDSAGNVAGFSSRGMTSGRSLKPDIGGPGVKIFGANADTDDGYESAQGTSLAAPMVTATVALLLSAAPELRPWEVRRLLQTTADDAARPDTAVGYGRVNIARALSTLSEERVIVGLPSLYIGALGIHASSWIATRAPEQLDRTEGLFVRHQSEARLRNIRTGTEIEATSTSPENGQVHWLFSEEENLAIVDGDRLAFTIFVDGSLVRRDTFSNMGATGVSVYSPISTICFGFLRTVGEPHDVVPNPSIDATTLTFSLLEPAVVSLDIFTLRGERAISVVNELPLDPGYHSYPVNTTGLAAGAYYYRLRIDEEVYSGQFILLGTR